MIPGNLVLAQLQQSDGRIKKRPVLVLTTMPPYNDLLVCGISSKLQQEVKGFDEVVSIGDSDFLTSGLKVSSVVRLGMVTTIPKSVVLGQLGIFASDRLFRLRNNLANHIKAAQDVKEF